MYSLPLALHREREREKRSKSETKMTASILSSLAFHLIFHCFSPFNCCLSVVLYLDKGDYPDNLQVVLS